MADEKPTEVKEELITGRAKGGYARAEALTSEQRKGQARKAALVRWAGDLPVATHEGEFPIGDSMISCAVLEDGRRIITQAAFLRAMKRARSPKAGTGVLTVGDDELPFFLQAEALKPFISDDLRMSTKAVFYITMQGGRGVGYDATLLPKTCEAYLKLRDANLIEHGKVPERYKKIITACDVVIRGLAGVAIIALIDEATGFQYARPSDALARILEAFIAKELRPWVHTFPEDYYRELFRLRGVEYSPASVKRPQYFGHLTNNIVYARLAPNVLEELKRRSERTRSGRLRHHHHRRLTEDIGHPKLRELLSSVVTIMKLSDGYSDFEKKLNRLHPKYTENLAFDFQSAEQIDSGF